VNNLSRKAQYERRFKAWGFQKNKKKDDWELVAFKVKKRKKEGKLSEVTMDGKPVPAKRLRKELSRYGYKADFQPGSYGSNCSSEVDIFGQIYSYDTALSPKTPEGIDICTPPATFTYTSLLYNLPWFRFQKMIESQGMCTNKLGFLLIILTT
jgi:hypothetical protein